MLDLGAIDLDCLAVIEYDRCCEMAIPFFVLVRCHSHWWF